MYRKPTKSDFVSANMFLKSNVMIVSKLMYILFTVDSEYLF